MSNTDSESNQTKPLDQKPGHNLFKLNFWLALWRKWRWLIVRGAILTAIVGGVVYGLIRASRGFADQTERVKFITVNLLSALVLLAIVIQAAIYWAQRNLMDEQRGEVRRQANLAREALVKIERPFVFLQGLTWKWHPDTVRHGKYWYSIHPTVGNSGNMPTSPHYS
jgi:hypothetical protein